MCCQPVQAAEKLKETPSAWRHLVTTRSISWSESIRGQPDQADRLRVRATRLQEQTARDEGLLKEMEEVLGLTSRLRTEALSRRLRGQRVDPRFPRPRRKRIRPGYVEFRDLLTAAQGRISAFEQTARSGNLIGLA